MITTSEGPWTRIGCIHAQGALTSISSRFLLTIMRLGVSFEAPTHLKTAICVLIDIVPSDLFVSCHVKYPTRAKQ